MTSSATSNEFRRSFDEVSDIYIAALRDGSDEPVAEVPPATEITGDDGVVFRDEKTKEVLQLAENVARTPSTVLLSGETGVGKEVFARFIHRKSPRSDGPMIGVNCAGFSASLLESELFGHEKGAFSGAVQQHIGVFEQADGGTLLLDEISEMPLELQATLLRVIQERQVIRVGGSDPIDVDIRIIATTNRDLEAYVEEGHFRQDLFFRLNVFPLEIPPLRERPKDIELLAKYYAKRLAATFDSPVEGFTPEAIEKLEKYSFPGNIRELINIVERALVYATQQRLIGVDHINISKSKSSAAADHEPPSGLYDDTEVEDTEASNDEQEEHVIRFRAGDDRLTDIRRVVIERALDRYDGNRAETARNLGVSSRTIRNKLKKYQSNSDSEDDS